MNFSVVEKFAIMNDKSQPKIQRSKPFSIFFQLPFKVPKHEFQNTRKKSNK